VTARRDRSLLLLLTGGFAVWLVLSGTALNFVRPGMAPYVLVAGVVAVLLGLAPESGVDAHGHGGASVGVGWLLVLPVLVGLVVPPSPLGANAVGSRLVTRSAAPGTFPPVGRAVGGAVPMSLAEYTTRALRDSHGSLAGVPVRIVGFVAAAPAGAPYRLGRFVIFCCAADAEAVEVAVSGDAVPRRRDQWLEVTGVWQPGSAAEDVPLLRATSVREVKRPGQPYEYTNVWSG
jgi:uncharacterized repeat protein (TIGR03943 family)